VAYNSGWPKEQEIQDSALRSQNEEKTKAVGNVYIILEFYKLNIMF
jgi:hypothetical protein